MRVPPRSATAWLVALGWLAGCARILDIEEAHVDERAAQNEYQGTQAETPTSTVRTHTAACRARTTTRITS